MPTTQHAIVRIPLHGRPPPPRCSPGRARGWGCRGRSRAPPARGLQTRAPGAGIRTRARRGAESAHPASHPLAFKSDSPVSMRSPNCMAPKAHVVTYLVVVGQQCAQDEVLDAAGAVDDGRVRHGAHLARTRLPAMSFPDNPQPSGVSRRSKRGGARTGPSAARRQTPGAPSRAAVQAAVPAS